MGVGQSCLWISGQCSLPLIRRKKAALSAHNQFLLTKSLDVARLSILHTKHHPASKPPIWVPDVCAPLGHPSLSKAAALPARREAEQPAQAKPSASAAAFPQRHKHLLLHTLAQPSMPGLSSKARVTENTAHGTELMPPCLASYTSFGSCLCQTPCLSSYMLSQQHHRGKKNPTAWSSQQFRAQKQGISIQQKLR